MNPHEQVNAAVSAITNEALVTQLAGKKIWQSKTIWVNTLAAAALFAQMRWGFIFDATTQTLALCGVNVLLRKITDKPIIW